MTSIEFLESLLLPHINEYMICLIFSISVHFSVLKKFVHGIIDPLFFTILTASFANSIPLFLFVYDVIKNEYFFYILIVELCLWGGFLGKARSKISSNPNELLYGERISRQVFYISLVLFILLKLVSYLLVGIPLFMVSRLDANEGGTGALDRFAYFPQFYCAVYAFSLFQRGKRTLPIFVVLLLSISSLLSGSKGAILVLLYAFFVYHFFYLYKYAKIKKRYLFILFCFVLCVVILQNEQTVSSAVTSILFRFVANGDVYWMAFPNSIIENIHVQDILKHLFSGILGPLRLVPYEDMEPAIGLQLEWTLYPQYEGISMGPNARMPVLSYVYFGWLGCLFAFVIGRIGAILMYSFSALFPRSLLTAAFSGYCYVVVQSIFTDVCLFVSNIFNVILIVPLYYIILLFVNGRYLILFHNE